MIKIGVAVISLTLPLLVFAHQPRIVEGTQVTVIEEPAISKVYDGELNGEPHIFYFEIRQPLDFKMNILVPDVPGAKRDVSAALFDPHAPEVPLAFVGGTEVTWKPFFKEFARNKYYQADEYRAELPSGEYQIRVWSSNNDSAYSLAVGETKLLDFWNVIDAYLILARIKSFFFEKLPLSTFFTPALAAPLGLLLIGIGGALLWLRVRSRKIY